MTIVSVRELKNQTSKILKRARDEDILITSYGKPIAVIKAVVRYQQRQEELSEAEMLLVAERSGSFDYLNDECEDIYSLKDGKPYEEG